MKLLKPSWFIDDFLPAKLSVLLWKVGSFASRENVPIYFYFKQKLRNYLL